MANAHLKWNLFFHPCAENSMEMIGRCYVRRLDTCAPPLMGQVIGDTGLLDGTGSS